MIRHTGTRPRRQSKPDRISTSDRLLALSKASEQIYFPPAQFRKEQPRSIRPYVSMKIFLFALSALALLSATHAADSTPLDQTAWLTQSPSANNRKLIFSGFSICDDDVTRDVGLLTFLFHFFTFQIFADIGECEAAAPACAALGASCTLDANCCSGNCDGGDCDVAPPPCAALGGTCKQDADCCSDNCAEGGVCGAPCISGGPCLVDDNCCDPSQGCVNSLKGGVCETCLRFGSACGQDPADGVCCTGSFCNSADAGTFVCGED